VFERIRHMLIKEFLQVIRDPRMRVVIFVMPCIQTLVIGYAVSTDVKHVATAIYDLDNTQDSRDLVARFISTGYFDAAEYVQNDAQARDAIDRGRASVVLHVQRGYSEDLRAGRTARVQFILDGSDSNTASIVMGYAARIVNGMSQQLLVERFTHRLGVRREPGLVDLRSRAWFNENLESRYFFVPGVIVIVVSIVTLLLTSMAVVREKEVGTMEQIIVTPITPVEFILGKTIPFALVAYIDVTLVSLVGVYWFGVPVRGSVALLFFSTGLYLMTMLGGGLFISTISETQQQAMMSTFFFFFPAMLLSGFVFPIDNMPRVVQWLDVVNPRAYFLVIVRGIFLKGVGIDVLWPQMLAMAIIGAIAILLAAKRFQKTAA
jgi:ABC-2 type transport system permease protein